MVALPTPIQPGVGLSPSPAPCVPPVALGFCPLCRSLEISRDVREGRQRFEFVCGSALKVGSADQPELMTTPICNGGWASELVNTLRAIVEQADYAPPTEQTLHDISHLARERIDDLRIYRIR